MRVSSYILILLLLLIFACKDPLSSNGPDVALVHGVSIIDTSISLRASYTTQTQTSPDLILDFEVILRGHGDSLNITGFFLELNNRSIFHAVHRVLQRDAIDTVRFQELLSNVVPFTSRLDLSVTVVGTSYVGSHDSTFSIPLNFRVRSLWDTHGEPGVQKVPTPMISWPLDIIWENSGQGFYFNCMIGPNQRVFKYTVGDSSCVPMTFPQSNAQVFDVSSDDATLLVSASDIFEYNISQGTQTLIIPSIDTVRFVQASYSADNNTIAINAAQEIELGKGIEIRYRMYIWKRSDSTLRRIVKINGADWAMPPCWLPNSNDRFIVFSGIYLLVYSVGSDSYSTISPPFDGYMWQLMPNGFNLTALQIHDYDFPQETHVWLTNLLGRDVRQLTFFPTYITSYSVSPNAAAVAFSGARNNVVGIWILPLVGIL